MNRKTFTVGMERVLRAYGLEKPGHSILDLYWEELECIPDRDFERGIGRLIRNYRYKTMPNPADFVFFACSAEPQSSPWAGNATEFELKRAAEGTYLAHKRRFLDRPALPAGKQKRLSEPKQAARDEEIERLQLQSEQQTLLILGLRKNIHDLEHQGERREERLATLRQQAEKIPDTHDCCDQPGKYNGFALFECTEHCACHD